MPITSRKVFSIYRTLDREQLRFVIEKVIEGSYTPDEWLKRLKRIAFMDLLGDETREKAGRLSMNFGILTAVTLVLAILRPVLFFFPIAFIIMFAYFFSLYMSLLKIDISNHMRVFLVPLIENFMDKIKNGSLVYLKMDFSNPVTGDKLSQTLETDKARAVKIFRHSWIKGKMTLTNGADIEWNIEDIIRQKKTRLVDKAEKMQFRDHEITHEIEIKIIAPAHQFQSPDVSLTPENGNFELEVKKEMRSENLEQGLDPVTFIHIVEENLARFKPLEPTALN